MPVREEHKLQRARFADCERTFDHLDDFVADAQRARVLRVALVLPHLEGRVLVVLHHNCSAQMQLLQN